MAGGASGDGATIEHHGDRPSSDEGGRFSSLAFLLGTLVVGFGLVAGAARLHDNSFFTHLATGRIMWETGGIPRVDPYSFTAAGEPWVVQSWLASWVYAGLEKLGGLAAVRAGVSVSAAAVAALVWLLTAEARSVLVRLGLAAAALAVIAPQWGERPLTLGLVWFGLTLLALQGRLDSRWLVPVGWLWANTHGSFPLGVVLVAVWVVGDWMDGKDWRIPVRVGAWLSGGILLGALNPLGPRILWFPVTVLDRNELFRQMLTEWRSPSFGRTDDRIFLLLVILAVLALVRCPRWRTALLWAVFVASALLSWRNLPVAALVLLPGLAAAAPMAGSLVGGLHRRLFGLGAAAAVVVCLAAWAVYLTGDDTKYDAYPVEEVAELEERGLVGTSGAPRLLTFDYVGNYLALEYGADAEVFIDDRFDMYPLAVLEDYRTFLSMSDSPQTVLDRWEIDAVLLLRDTPIGQWFAASPQWTAVDVGVEGDEWGLWCPEHATEVCEP